MKKLLMILAAIFIVSLCTAAILAIAYLFLIVPGGSIDFMKWPMEIRAAYAIGSFVFWLVSVGVAAHEWKGVWAFFRS